jgi:hypothetical protein
MLEQMLDIRKAVLLAVLTMTFVSIAGVGQTRLIIALYNLGELLLLIAFRPTDANMFVCLPTVSFRENSVPSALVSYRLVG